MIAARAVVIATGGAAALWSRTTNPPGSQGVGMLLAHPAGAALADLELMQFHPTAVTGVPGREGFLVTEAIRGEGATLHDSQASASSTSSRRETRFRGRSRRSSESSGERLGEPGHAGDRSRALPERRRARCGTRAWTRTRELVPVAPAAHYMMGGMGEMSDIEKYSFVESPSSQFLNLSNRPSCNNYCQS